MAHSKRTRAAGGRGATGSAWAYWPVYVGGSLAALLVTAGVTLAIQHLNHPQAVDDRTAAADVAAIPPPYSATRDAQTVSRQTNLPALEVRDRMAAVLPLVPSRKLIPEMPLQAAKLIPEFMTPAPVTQALAKAEPLKDNCQPVNLLPDTPTCASKLVTAMDQPAVCSTNVPFAARNDPTYGTAIHFVDSPTVAVRDALKEDKLVFVLHVSGNFEDPDFT